MKKGMCRGCDNLLSIVQEQNWESDGVTRLPETRKVMKPYCREFKLHLEWVERLQGHEGDNPCQHYYKGGVS